MPIDRSNLAVWHPIGMLKRSRSTFLNPWRVIPTLGAISGALWSLAYVYVISGLPPPHWPGALLLSLPGMIIGFLVGLLLCAFWWLVEAIVGAARAVISVAGRACGRR